MQAAKESTGLLSSESWSASSRRAFTLIELLISMVILSIFLFFAYELFIGGSKTASKSQWISSAIDQLRNGTAFLNKELKSTSYPTTLLADTILDPCSNNDPKIAEAFFVKIKEVNKKIEAPDSGKILLMSWVVCQPEKVPNPGKITHNNLWLSRKSGGLQKAGELKIEQKSYTFKTDAASQYAKSGKLAETKDPSKKDSERTLVTDVQSVKFMVMPPYPTNAAQPPSPISIQIRCQYPKDGKVFKENSIMITPNVGIKAL